jgi:eukaryotic-like serine/threonine-protein kinase
MNRPAFSYRFGAAEFDESRFELRVAGLPVEVERRALEVLVVLLRHAGEVVTKEELLGEVWAGRITVDKVLPNAINKLRRALGEANAVHISTQARLGYRLDGTVTRTAVGRQVASELALVAGQTVPGRQHFVLQSQFGQAGGGEVWLAHHAKTREQRIYKFALGSDRLRALKREATLLRLLQESTPQAPCFVEILDWNFELAPYFLECKYGGLALNEWSVQHLKSMNRAARIALFLQVADAVALAHAVGVLHKDLKPSNVLVEGEAANPQVRLSDFGSGHMLEPDRLAQLGITRLGMTVEDGAAGSDSTSGTPLYLAPELYDGQAPTVRSDVFSLGVLFYQLLTDRPGQPMAPGWESHIEDPLLREDLRLATDGEPQRRLGSVAQLADRLRQLEPRRAALASQNQAQEAARRDRELLAKARARRPYVVGLVAVLVVSALSALWLLQRAERANQQAHMELNRATALTRFLNVDLIGRANPLVWAKGSDATLREILLSARERVADRFATQPATAAAIHSSLATSFHSVDLFQEAEAEALRSLELAKLQSQSHPGAELEARVVLVRVLSRRGSFQDAEGHLQELQRRHAQAPSPASQQLLATANSALLMARGDMAKAVVALREAIGSASSVPEGKASERDVMRVDLIQALALAGLDDQALEEGRMLIQEAKGRKEDGSLLIALTQVALVRAQGENHSAAQQLLLAAQPVVKAQLGENHSRHVHLLGEMLGVAFRSGDWPRATLLAQTVHERMRAKFGPDHVSTFVTLVNWARTLDEAGRPKEALARAHEAHQQLLRLVGPASPKTQDAAFVLALVLLELGESARAQILIDQLDPAVLESGRATGQWASGIDALRGMALQQRGDSAAARVKLDAALAALKGEEDLAQPSRLYLEAQRARARLR